MTGLPQTYLAQLLALRGMRQAELARGLGVNRQQVSKWAKEGRRIAPAWAKRIEPLVNVPWPDLVDSKLPQELAPGVEHGVLIRERDPKAGDRIYDVDELALLTMWRRLNLTKQAALFAYFGDAEMPSLRKTV